MSSRIRRGAFAALATTALLAVATGCASPATVPTRSLPPEAESGSPTPTGSVTTGFAVPKDCADLVSPATAHALSDRGVGSAQAYLADVPIGAPFQVGDPVGQGLDVGTVTDYLYCYWGEMNGPHVEILLAAVGPDTSGPWSNEIRYWEFGVARTADGLTWSTDGDVTNNAGRVTGNIGYAGYWILREHSMIQVGISPGSPAALREAISIQQDIVAVTGAN